MPHVTLAMASPPFAAVNLKPVVPGHVLVSPKRVVARFAELSPEEVCPEQCSPATCALNLAGTPRCLLTACMGASTALPNPAAGL